MLWLSGLLFWFFFWMCKGGLILFGCWFLVICCCLFVLVYCLVLVGMGVSCCLVGVLVLWLVWCRR